MQNMLTGYRPKACHTPADAISASEANLNTSLVKSETLASKSDDRRMQIWQEIYCPNYVKWRSKRDAVGRAILIDIITYGK
jgi:hypothetical protein